MPSRVSHGQNEKDTCFLVLISSDKLFLSELIRMNKLVLSCSDNTIMTTIAIDLCLFITE